MKKSQFSLSSLSLFQRDLATGGTGSSSTFSNKDYASSTKITSQEAKPSGVRCLGTARVFGKVFFPAALRSAGFRKLWTFWHPRRLLCKCLPCKQLCWATEGARGSACVVQCRQSPRWGSSGDKPVGCYQYFLMMPTVSECDLLSHPQSTR